MSDQAQYLHVVVWLKPVAGIGRLIFSDLSEADLKRRFVKPYNRGRSILIGGETINLMDVSAVQIVRTSDPKDSVLRRLADEQAERDRRNSNSWVIFAGAAPDDADIGSGGDDVTGEYISQPPGNKNGLGIMVRLALEHPIIAGLVVLLIAALVSWWWQK